MKNSFLFAFLLIVFSLSLVSSVDISVKETVKKGENFIVKVSGTFVKPLTADNVQFYRRHMKTSMGKFELEKIEGDYYFFLEIPLEKEPDNYSIVLDGIEYYVGRYTSEEPIYANFTIVNEIAPFSVSPPLVVTNTTYTVTLQNLLNTTIVIDLEKSTKTFEAMNASGETVETGGFLDALFGLFKPKTNVTSNNTTTPTTINVNTTKISTISLKSGEIKSLEYSAPAKKGFEKLEFYYNGEPYGVLVYALNDKFVPETEKNETNKTVVINGTEIGVIENGTIINKTTNVSVGSAVQNCSQLNAKVCKVNEEKCTGNTTYSLTQICCLGDCVSTKKSSSGKIIGWIIIGIIFLFLIWFLKIKYLRSRPGKVNLLEVAKGKK